MSGTWLLTHGLVSALFFLDRNKSILDQFFEPPLLPVWILVPIMTLMVLTSNEYSEKKLGKLWKNIHNLVWLLPPIMVYHGNLSIVEFEKEDFAPAMIILGLVAITAIYEFIKTRSYRRLLLLLAGQGIAMALYMISVQ